MDKKIVVMGGSFNPPTRAHFRILQSAIDQISTNESDPDARGIFVPSSDAYVQRKMSKLPPEADHTVLPEKLRYDMLQSFHEDNFRLSVDGRELGTTAVRGHTVETLQAIQQENPNAEVLFIFGSDKLEGLPRWGSFLPLINQFKLILFGRDGQELLQTIRSVPALSEHEDSFIVMCQPEGLDGISSTLVREKLCRNERVDDMLTTDVYTMLLAHKNQKENTILCFEGEYRFLSNFSHTYFSWDFWPYWTSAEAAFQSAKCKTQEEREQFTRLTPAQAKKMGQRVDLRSDWEQVKDGIMECIVHEKFFQMEPLARKLMATGDAELIEGNTWGDTYWGVDLHTMQYNVPVELDQQ